MSHAKPLAPSAGRQSWGSGVRSGYEGGDPAAATTIPTAKGRKAIPALRLSSEDLLHVVAEEHEHGEQTGPNQERGQVRAAPVPLRDDPKWKKGMARAGLDGTKATKRTTARLRKISVGARAPPSDSPW